MPDNVVDENTNAILKVTLYANDTSAPINVRSVDDDILCQYLQKNTTPAHLYIDYHFKADGFAPGAYLHCKKPPL